MTVQVTFTENATQKVGRAKTGRVTFTLPSAADLGGGNIQVQAIVAGAPDTVAGSTLVANLENQFECDFGPDFDYQLVMAAATNPNATVVVQGTYPVS